MLHILCRSRFSGNWRGGGLRPGGLGRNQEARQRGPGERPARAGRSCEAREGILRASKFPGKLVPIQDTAGYRRIPQDTAGYRTFDSVCSIYVKNCWKLLKLLRTCLKIGTLEFCPMVPPTCRWRSRSRPIFTQCSGTTSRKSGSQARTSSSLSAATSVPTAANRDLHDI